MKRVLIVLSLMLCLVFSATSAKAANSFTGLFSLETNMSLWAKPNLFTPAQYTEVTSIVPSSGYYDVSLAYVSTVSLLALQTVPTIVDMGLDYVDGLLPAAWQGSSLLGAISQSISDLISGAQPTSGQSYGVDNVYISSFLTNLLVQLVDLIPDVSLGDIPGLENIPLLNSLSIGLDLAMYQYTGADKNYEWNGVSFLVPTDSIFVGLSIFGLPANMDLVFLVSKAANAVPIPGAIFLLAPGIAGIAALRRKMA